MFQIDSCVRSYIHTGTAFQHPNGCSSGNGGRKRSWGWEQSKTVVLAIYLSGPTPATGEGSMHAIDATIWAHGLIQAEMVKHMRKDTTCICIKCVWRYYSIFACNCTYNYIKTSARMHFCVWHTVVSTESLLHVQDSCRQGVHVPVYLDKCINTFMWHTHAYVCLSSVSISSNSSSSSLLLSSIIRPHCHCLHTAMATCIHMPARCTLQIHTPCMQFRK